jgi:hypothetical protein
VRLVSVGSNRSPLGDPSTHPLAATLRRALVLVGAVSTLLACSASSDPVQVPKGWRFFDAGPFTFYAPSDVADVPLNGKPIDSYVREFQGDAVILMSDYGAYSNSLGDTGEASFHSHDESIGGKAARMVSYTGTPSGEFRYPNFVGVYFAHTNKRNISLSMVASCDGAPSCHVAEDIFRTIRFP